MQIWTPHDDIRDDGEFPVYLYPGAKNGKPFALIYLSENEQTALNMQTLADCDRLTKAVARARELLLGAASESVPAPAPQTGAEPTCLSQKPGTSTSCQRPAGHAGGHKNYAKDDYWPQDSAEDDAGRAIVGDYAEYAERGVSESNREESGLDRGDI